MGIASLDWNDTLGLARCLVQNPDFKNLDLTSLTAENLENLIVSSGYAESRLAKGDLRDNTLNSIRWHWIRLQDEPDMMRGTG